MWYRKDSFVTHRAFCDALAEDNARFASVSAANPNFRHDLIIKGSISNPSRSGISQLSSAFPPEFIGSESGGTLIVDGHKPKLPLWLDHPNSQLNPTGTSTISNGYFATGLISLPDQLVPAASMNMFGSTSQTPAWLNKYPEACFTSANIPVSSFPRDLKEEEENKGNLSESVAALLSDNQNHQQGPAHMSATALLQKAAQMGSTTSNPAFNSTAFRLMSSSHSNVPNSTNETHKFFRQQNQAGNLKELTSSLSSTPTIGREVSLLAKSNSSSYSVTTKNREYMGMAMNGNQDQLPVSGKTHAASTEMEHSLTRDFLGVGGQASRPFLQQELARFASMGAAMDLAPYSTGHHQAP